MNLTINNFGVFLEQIVDQMRFEPPSGHLLDVLSANIESLCRTYKQHQVISDYRAHINQQAETITLQVNLLVSENKKIQTIKVSFSTS